MLTLRDVVVLVCAALLTACAPPPKATKATDRSAALRSAGLAAGNEDANWRCPYDTNVNLKDYIGSGGWDYTGTGNYKVCVSRSNTATFKISGTTSSRTLCIYPMRAGNTSTIAQAEQAKCFAISGSPIEVTFTAKDINYMTIVDVNFTDAMAACLSGPSPCPSHSEGFVQ